MPSTAPPDTARAILVVSDHPPMRSVVAAWLESAAQLPYGTHVATADCGFEMYELLALRRFDALLVCAESPSVGASVVRGVKSDPRYADLPCLLGNHRELSHLVRDGAACGADYLISYADHTAEDLALFLWDAFEAPPLEIPEAGYFSPACTELRHDWNPAWNRLPL